MDAPNEPAVVTCTNNDLLDLSREALIEKVQELQNINAQLSKHHRVKKGIRKFDFSRFKKRHIALKVAYLGWNMQGFAIQDASVDTVEGHLFEALQKTCLTEDIKKANYSRCGRTDKGVSAFGQVIALHVRSKHPSNKCSNTDEDVETSSSAGTCQTEDELPYVRMLNKTLPQEIRVLAWTPVPSDFSARFSCRSRTYKYFFPVGNLDIARMKIAAAKLVGEHDFRNFCKVDSGNNITHFIRRVISFEISPCHLNHTSGYDMYQMEICGMAFLWHQVRCMASVLLHVGLRLEEPEVIDKLLDVKNCPRRPQYTIASEIPLILYDCAFDDLQWIYEPGEKLDNLCSIQKIWTDYAVRTVMLRWILNGIEHCQNESSDMDTHESGSDAVLALLPGYRKKHRPLMERPVCEGLERHLEKQAKKRRRFEESSTAKRTLMNTTDTTLESEENSSNLTTVLAEP